MKELTKILKSRKFSQAKKKLEKQEIIAKSVHEYLDSKSPIINVQAIKNSINDLNNSFTGSDLQRLANPNENSYMGEVGIKHKSITDIVKEIVGEKKGFEILIKREGFGNRKPFYILFLDKELCMKKIEEYIGESKKILEYTLHQITELYI